MSTANVTAINAGKPRRAKRNSTVSLGGLTDPDTFNGFTMHDLISGLHGVCVAIDSAIVDGAQFEDHRDTMCGLAQAAKVLSSILNTQVHS
jgi:hypothetical protein